MVRDEGLHEEKTAVKKLLHGCSSSSGGNKEMGFRANTCISIVSIRSLTTCINTAMYLSSPGVCFHTLHPFRPVWMLWVPTGETLGTGLSAQPEKTQCLWVIQSWKEDFHEKHFSACSGPCASGKVAKTRNVATERK